MKKKLLIAFMLCAALFMGACGSKDDAANNDSSATEAQDDVADVEEETAAPEETQEDAAETAEDDGKVLYAVTVVDESGNPISGAMVQLCMDSCFPGATGDDGVAQFSLVEGDYKVSFLMLPEGYDYSGEEQEFYFDDGATEITITLKAAE